MKDMKTKYRSIPITFCFLLLIVMESFSQSGDTRYYYAYNKKIFLDKVANKFIVSHNNSSTVKDLLLQLYDKSMIEWQNDSVCIINTDDRQSSSIKEILLSRDEVKSVHPVYATANELEMGVTADFVVQFKKDASPEEIRELHKKHNTTVQKTTELYQLLSVTPDSDALEIANEYQLSGLVEYSHPDFIAKIEFNDIPPDPYFVNQFYLNNTGQTVNGHSCTSGADINAPEAWDITKGSSDIIIAVLDQGVTSNHPDLPNTRQVRLNGSNFGDGNVNDPSPTGNMNHGNACAGVIAAMHNYEGVAGIAPACKVMPIRIFSSENNAGIALTSIANAITFAKNNGAHILSNSWTYNSADPDLVPTITSAIADAVANGRGGKGCVVVFAAGNWANHVQGDNGYVSFPSNVEIPGVLAVGASDRNDAQANYSPTSNLNSSQNQIVDIVAPSQRANACYIPTEVGDIWTIDIPGDAGYNPVKGNNCGLPVLGSILPNSGTNYKAYTAYFGGTSAACPQVAAVAALILSLKPNLTQLQVSNIIGSTARKAGNYTYQTTSGLPLGTWNPQMGYGVLDAYAAVQSACPTTSYANRTLTSNTLWSGCTINMQNVTVQNSATLQLDIENKVTIGGTLTVQSGSSLQVY
jgi:subtilisin family serine protease